MQPESTYEDPQQNESVRTGDMMGRLAYSSVPWLLGFSVNIVGVICHVQGTERAQVN